MVIDEGKTLVRATVWWADALDRNHAKKWTKNVQHELFDEAVLEPITAREAEGGESQSVPAELVAEKELTANA
ncbi:hypothetical protein O1611_g9429 [Lasiodiplodia mahajangana]|uniref:Uncharacterized protein n=1 Tax=Lasiodiplodia mahajangana TaxID=1108764 RepID=A0ACC2J9G5_9PEZI|nr:hypothetical protein O1611_g9429 [Lasiodiplodia mahajangana]